MQPARLFYFRLFALVFSGLALAATEVGNLAVGRFITECVQTRVAHAWIGDLILISPWLLAFSLQLIFLKSRPSLYFDACRTIALLAALLACYVSPNLLGYASGGCAAPIVMDADIRPEFMLSSLLLLLSPLAALLVAWPVRYWRRVTGKTP